MPSHRAATGPVDVLEVQGAPEVPNGSELPEVPDASDVPVPVRRRDVRRRAASPRRPARRDGRPVTAVLGELLIACGLLVLLFLVWKLGWNDRLAASAQTAAAVHHADTWARQGPVPGSVVGTAPVVRREPEQQGTVLGVLWVPRFGASYARTIAQGVGSGELSSFALGVGHYPGSAMPGSVGNFAIAGHRSAYGGAMHVLDTLRRGDRIVIETRDGWYTYRFVREIVVDPDAVGVLAPAPAALGAPVGSRVITLTTCTPLYSTAQRIVAFGVFDSFRPRTASGGTRA